MGAGVKRALQPRGHWLLAPTLLTRRTTLALIVGIGVVIGLVFGIAPQLDLRISALFYDPVQRTWPAADSALFISYRDLSYYLPIILVMIAVVVRSAIVIHRRRRASLLMRLARRGLPAGLVPARPGLDHQCAAQAAMGPAAPGRGDAVRRASRFHPVVEPVRAMRRQLLVRIRRGRRWRSGWSPWRWCCRNAIAPRPWRSPCSIAP